MSMQNQTTINCPKCGNEHPFIVWDTFNADVSKNLIDDFLSGQIFNFTCPDCGNTVRVDYPMLYHDMTHKIVMTYAEQADDYHQNMLKRAQIFLDMGYQYRIVESKPVLLEKALIFHEGYDDRTIEVLKYLTLLKIQQDYPESEFDKILFYKDENGFSLAFIGENNMNATITQEAIDGINLMIKYDELKTTNSEYRIDLKWAKDYLEYALANINSNQS